MVPILKPCKIDPVLFEKESLRDRIKGLYMRPFSALMGNRERLGYKYVTERWFDVSKRNSVSKCAWECV